MPLYGGATLGANTFTGNQTVNGNLSAENLTATAGGTITGGAAVLSSYLLQPAPTTVTGATHAMVTADVSLIFNRAAGVTVTLQNPAAFPGRWLHMKNIAAGAVVSASSNVAPIDSATPGTAILAATAGKWALLQSDGTSWVIMAAN